MKGSSFRDILAQFLEENQGDSPLKTDEKKRFQPEPSPLLEWNSGDLGFMKKGGYPPPTSRKSAPAPEAKPARPVAQESFFTREQLPAVGRDAIATLLTLGAVELKEKVSVTLVKKAHRRLAKALHPDLILESLTEIEKRRRREQFLLLQAAYETLSSTLKTLTLRDPSDSASDSGSASEQGSRRQDAA